MQILEPPGIMTLHCDHSPLTSGDATVVQHDGVVDQSENINEGMFCHLWKKKKKFKNLPF